MLQESKPQSNVPPAKPTSLADPHLQYRTLNRAAVGSLALAVFGLTALISPLLVVMPLAGFLLGFSAWRTIKRFPDEYTGLNLARLGMAASLLLAIGVLAWHGYVYATEVPEGYKRVSFSELQPDGLSPGLPIPQRAVELRGEKVFIKGYMHPGVSGMGKVRQFVLVPDMGTCCFGGQPKLTDMILVQTTEEAKAAYAPRTLRVAGEFNLGDHLQDFGDVKNVLYRLECDYSK
jgi:hypothetical protein